jgi:hypothetical protein
MTMCFRISSVLSESGIRYSLRKNLLAIFTQSGWVGYYSLWQHIRFFLTRCSLLVVSFVKRQSKEDTEVDG